MQVFSLLLHLFSNKQASLKNTDEVSWFSLIGFVLIQVQQVFSNILQVIFETQPPNVSQPYFV